MLLAEDSAKNKKFKGTIDGEEILDSWTLQEYFEKKESLMKYPMILDLEITDDSLSEFQEIKHEALIGNYNPKLEIFGKFNDLGGIDKILNYSLESLRSGGGW